MISRYRREKKLSQEELGNMLNVSRQTVSLWETGQTVPTIDNLVRLKEIFGVSVDRLLGCEEETVEHEDAPPEPKEKYRFRYNGEEVKSICRRMNAKRITVRIIVYLMWFLIALGLTIQDERSLGILILTIICITVLSIIAAVRYSKAVKKAAASSSHNAFLYDIFDDHMIITIEKDGEEITRQKLYFADIEKLYELDEYYLIRNKEKLYTIRRDGIAENSVLTEVFDSLPAGKRERARVELTGSISWLLFILTLVAWPVACVIIFDFINGVVPQDLSPMERLNIEQAYMWRFWLFTPIPASSIVFGFLTRKKISRRALKNIIAGIVVLVIILGFGAFALL